MVEGTSRGKMQNRLFSLRIVDNDTNTTSVKATDSEMSRVDKKNMAQRTNTCISRLDVIA